jgi:hypothetical protein
VPDLKDGQSRAIQIEDGLAGLFEYFFWQYAGPGIEIMDQGCIM